MVARWFRIAYAENAFRRYVAEQDRDIDALRASEAVRLVLGFYRAARAQHALVSDEGDGILWQWGPDADATRFTVDLTRQLIREDDEAITQLCVTLVYRWTPGRRLLGRGHAWCFSPGASSEFEREIRGSAAYKAIAAAAPIEVLVRSEVL
jgi:hypothetical protein